MIILLRKLKAAIFGTKPCSFEYSHGHDFEIVSVKKFSGGTYVKLTCKVCGKQASVDKYSGLEIMR